MKAFFTTIYGALILSVIFAIPKVFADPPKNELDPPKDKENLNLVVTLNGPNAELKAFDGIFAKSKLANEKKCIKEFPENSSTFTLFCNEKSTNQKTFKEIGELYLDHSTALISKGNVSETTMCQQVMAALDCSSVHCKQVHNGACSAFGGKCYHSNFPGQGAHECHSHQ